MALTFQQKERGTWSFNGVGVKASADELDSATPTITSGSGVPSSTEPAGSLYLRTGSSNADTALYVMISTTWTAILGAS
jgi:hypothetical protein